jgi:large subunit ribosomal protein L7A
VPDRLKSNNKAVGIKQCTKAVESGTAKVVFIAKDAEERVIRNIKATCTKNSIEILYVDNMKLLGKACGIEVGAAIACTLK